MPRDPYQELIFNEMLRRDPKRQAANKTEKFLSDRQAERQSRLSETLGLDDILNFLPAGQAVKAARIGSPVNAAVNALAFTSQFSDNPEASKVQDALAMFPVFGTGTARLKALSERNLKVGKDLPFFGQGNISPRRQRQIEAGMREMAKDPRVKDPQKLAAELDKTFERWGDRWGKKPIPARQFVDNLPASVRYSFDKTIAPMGYGGIDTGFRSKAPMDKFGNRVTKAEHLAEYGGTAVTGGKMNPTQIAPSKYTWEQKYARGEQSPEAIERLNARPDVSWVTRPGETLQPGMRPLRDVDPKTKAFLENLAIGSAFGTGARILGAQEKNAEGGDQKAGLVLNARNLSRLKKLQTDALLRLNNTRPNTPAFNELEAMFAAKYPRLYENATTGLGGFHPDFESIPGQGGYHPSSGAISVGTHESGYTPDDLLNIYKTMAHETIHANDFQRLGKIFDPATKTKISGTEFVPIRSSQDTKNSIANRMELFNPSEADRVRILQGEYLTPEAASSLLGSRERGLARYRRQPVEARAIQAGTTGASTLGKLDSLLRPGESSSTRQLKRYLDMEDTKASEAYDPFKRFLEIFR